MKKIVLLITLLIFLTGCTNNSSSEPENSIVDKIWILNHGLRGLLECRLFNGNGNDLIVETDEKIYVYNNDNDSWNYPRKSDYKFDFVTRDGTIYSGNKVSENYGRTWRNIKYPIYISELNYQDGPDNSVMIYNKEKSFIALSYNKCRSWKYINTPDLNSNSIYEVKTAAGDSTIIIAYLEHENNLYTNKFLRYNKKSDSWDNFFTGMPDEYLGLGKIIYSAGTMYIFTVNKIFASDDDFKTHTINSLQFAFQNHFTCNGDLYYIHRNRFFKSTNLGTDWEMIKDDSLNVSEFTYDKSGNIFFHSDDYKLYKLSSEDNQITNISCMVGIGADNIHALDSGRIFFVFDNKLYITMTTAPVWDKIAMPDTEPDFNISHMVAFRDRLILYDIDKEQLYYSYNEGASWHSINLKCSDLFNIYDELYIFRDKKMYRLGYTFNEISVDDDLDFESIIRNGDSYSESISAVKSNNTQMIITSENINREWEKLVEIPKEDLDITGMKVLGYKDSIVYAGKNRENFYDFYSINIENNEIKKSTIDTGSEDNNAQIDIENMILYISGKKLKVAEIKDGKAFKAEEINIQVNRLSKDTFKFIYGYSRKGVYRIFYHE